MMGSETFIMVALRCRETIRPLARQPSSSALKKLVRADLRTVSESSPATSTTETVSAVFMMCNCSLP